MQISSISCVVMPGRMAAATASRQPVFTLLAMRMPSICSGVFIRSLDTDCLDGLLSHRLLVTVEEHTVCGGLGGAVAEYLAPKAKRPPHLLIGIADEFPHTGSYDYMLKACGLTAEQIAARIRSAIDETA